MEFKTSIGDTITRRWVSLCLCICWIMFLGQPGLSQVLESDLLWNSYEQLGKIDERVINIGKNLLEISKSLGSRDPEQQYLDYLLNSYQKTSMLLEHATDLIWLYDTMASRERGYVRVVLSRKIKTKVEGLELEIKATNNVIALTHRPEVAKPATELRTALHQGIDILNAVQLH